MQVTNESSKPKSIPHPMNCPRAQQELQGLYTIRKDEIKRAKTVRYVINPTKDMVKIKCDNLPPSTHL